MVVLLNAKKTSYKMMVNMNTHTQPHSYISLNIISNFPTFNRPRLHPSHHPVPCAFFSVFFPVLNFITIAVDCIINMFWVWAAAAAPLFSFLILLVAHLLLLSVCLSDRCYFCRLSFSLSLILTASLSPSPRLPIFPFSFIPLCLYC